MVTISRQTSESGAILTVPNALTGLRIVMTIVAGILFVDGRAEVVAVAMCISGTGLDAVDGWYARRFRQCTYLGRFLDPLADKLLTGLIFGVIAVGTGSILVWILFGLVAGRDVVVTASRSWSIRRDGVAFPADLYGKVKMVFQSVAGSVILVNAFVFGVEFSTLHYPIVVTFVVTIALSYLSAARYLRSTGPIRRVGVQTTTSR